MIKEDFESLRELYPTASELELKILYLADNEYKYSDIKQELKNISKKKVKDVLLKYEPSLLDSVNGKL